ncbi:MAG: hypothetical protein HYX76_13255 [Acidobacteria bacterium]|nr:hypothetical protein [Acidobacteriota bacterium]
MERDGWLRRIERDAVIVCAGAAVMALVGRRGDPGLAIGVVAGGVLAWISYRAIKRGVDAMVEVMAPPSSDAWGYARRAQRRPKSAWALVTFAGRYALLAFFAYAMIARLRVHPLGLLIGASSMVAAVAIEAIRTVAGSGESQGQS